MTAAADQGNTPQGRQERAGTEAEFAPRVHATLRDPAIGLRWRGLTNASGVFAILAVSGYAVLPNARATLLPESSQQSAVPAAEAPAQEAPAVAPVISYVDGQLSIKALNATLGEVLAKVASLTGVKFDVPSAANNDRMPFVELGPGTAREVLAELLSDSNFDYLLAASETDPDKIQSVLLMLRDKSGSKANRMDAASRQPRGSFGRSVPSPAESEAAVVPDNSAQPGNTASDAAQPNSQSAPSASDQSTRAPVLQPGQSNVPRTAPVPLPSSLDTQSISQQLQQMYQQRVQLNQQMHQAPPPNAIAGPPNN